MRFWTYLGTIFLALSFAFRGAIAFASGPDSIAIERGQLERFLHSFDGTIDVSSSIFCDESFHELRVEGCGSKNPAVIQTFARASRKLEALKSQAEKYSKKPEIRTNEGYRDKTRKILKTISCITGKLSDIRIQCEPEGGVCTNANAYTIPLFSIFGVDKIFFCPHLDEVPQEYRDAVIIHEISHLCGTLDHEYFSDPYFINGTPITSLEKEIRVHYGPPGKGFKGKKKIQIDISTDNADTYEYWIRKGFCLPGFDC